MAFKSTRQRKKVMSILNPSSPSDKFRSNIKKNREVKKAESKEEALAKALNKKKSEVEKGRGDNIYEIDGEEWLVFDSYKDAEHEAEDRVRQDLENNPELFSKDWLSNHTYISDTDKRIISQEESDNYVDNLDDDDIEEQVKGSESIEKKRESLRGERYDEIYAELKRDPEDYFVNQQGIYTHDEYVKQSFVSMDVDSATKDAIQTDGVAHFLSSYDGNETEKDGYYMYRVN
jgi:hypothetical protein